MKKMDISPLADKQQQNKNRNNSRQQRPDDRSRLDEYSPLSSANQHSREVLSSKRIQALIETLNRKSGAMDISFEIKQPTSLSTRDAIVEVIDSKENEMLLELTMADLVEIDKQINEDSVEDLSELMCGSFFSLTA